MFLSLVVLIGIGAYWGIPTYLLHRGENALQAGHYDDAERYFELSQSWPSQRSAAILGQIKVARFTGETSRALAMLATSRAQGVSESQSKLERSLLQIQCGHSESIVDEVPSLLVQFPERGSEILEAVVTRFATRGDPERALQHVNDWIEADPGNARALALKGEILATLGKTTEAESFFRQAIRLNPALQKARYSLARLLKLLGRYDEAIELFDAELQHTPQDVRLRLLRCDTLLQARRNQEAIEGLREVIKLDDLNFPARHSLASELAEQGEYAEVIETLQPLVNEFSNDTSINYLLATAYDDQGNRERAEQHMQRYLDGRKHLDELALQTQGDDIDSAGSRVLIEIAKGYLKYQWDQSEVWIVKAIQRSSGSPESFLLMAEFQRKKGDKEREAEYRRAARND